MATGFSLTVKEGPDAGRRVELQHRSFLLGRDPICDLVINDIEVSRRHARLIAQSGGYTIEDLGSTNGTFVNGQRIHTVVPLHPGDSLGLGQQVTLVYEVVPAEKMSALDFATTPPSSSLPLPPRSMRAEALKSAAEPPASLPELSAQPAPPMPSRLRPRRKGLRLPIFSRPWLIGCGIVLLLGLCSTIAFLWYVDANYLWCDVFGTLISACR